MEVTIQTKKRTRAPEKHEVMIMGWEPHPKPKKYRERFVLDEFDPMQDTQPDGHWVFETDDEDSGAH